MLSTTCTPAPRSRHSPNSSDREVSNIGLPEHVVPTPISVPQSLVSYSDFPETQNVDLKNLDLVPFADGSDIQNRWIRVFFSHDEQTPKVFHPHTVQYVTCVLRSYPKHMLCDQGVPPIIHPKQVDARWLPVPLANCYSLVRLWETCVPGSQTMAANTVKQEMERLITEVSTYTYSARLV